MACSNSKRWNRTNRQNIIHSICVYALFLILGWIRGLFGPSLVDLLLISDVSLKLGSWISTLAFIGYAIGCVAGGFLFDKVNKNLLYAAGIVLVGIVTAAIPWCFIFALMVVAHFLQGLSSGVADTVGNAELISIWRENKMMFFIIELSYSTGVFVAPLIVAPFLSDVATSEHHDNGTVSYNVTSQSPLFITSATTANSSISNLTRHSESHEEVLRLFIPFSISGGLALLISLPFVIRYFMEIVQSRNRRRNSNAEGKEKNNEEEAKIRALPTKLKVLCLMLITVMMFLGLSLGESSVSFIAVYSIEEMGFTPAEGALLNAVSSVCGIFAIIVAMLIPNLNTLVLLGIHNVGALVAFLALLFSSIAQSNIGVWVSAAFIGYFRSMIFSLTFTWTNNYITPTTGKVSSLFMMSSCSGAAVGPLFLGWLMEEYTYLWFCYLLIIFGSVQVMLYIVGMFLTKYVTSVYGKTFTNVVIEDISLTEKLNKEESLDMK